MYRSQSQQRSRLSYQNISSRINRLRTIGTPHSSQTKPIITTSHNTPTNISLYPGSRPSSCYRSNLKVQQGAMFGIDISNHVGRVAKNTGIKKYQQRQIKDVLNRNSQKYSEQPYMRSNEYDIIGNHQLRNHIVMSNPRLINISEQNSQFNGKSTIKLYDYIQEGQNKAQRLCTTPSKSPTQSQKGLEPGKIYTTQQLIKMM